MVVHKKIWFLSIYHTLQNTLISYIFHLSIFFVKDPFKCPMTCQSIDTAKFRQWANRNTLLSQSLFNAFANGLTPKLNLSVLSESCVLKPFYYTDCNEHLLCSNKKVTTIRCFQVFINHLWIYQVTAKNLKRLTCNKQFTELSFRIPNKRIPGTVKFKFIGDFFNESPRLNDFSVRGER